MAVSVLYMKAEIKGDAVSRLYPLSSSNCDSQEGRESWKGSPLGREVCFQVVRICMYREYRGGRGRGVARGSIRCGRALDYFTRRRRGCSGVEGIWRRGRGARRSLALAVWGVRGVGAEVRGLHNGRRQLECVHGEPERVVRRLRVGLGVRGLGFDALAEEHLGARACGDGATHTGGEIRATDLVCGCDQDASVRPTMYMSGPEH